MPKPVAVRKWYQIKKTKAAASGAAPASADVLIFGDIGENWWNPESVTAINLVRELQGIDATEINVRINSYGGAVSDGLAIYNALRAHPATINTINEGVAVSIASLIMMAGDNARMAENSLFMIHAPWGSASGNSTELRQYADVLDKYAEAMSSSYARKTGLPVADMLALLTDGADHWYTADEALAAGFADEITDAIQIAASLPPNRYRNLPAAAAAFTRQQETAAMPKENTDDQKGPTTDINVVEIKDAATKAAHTALQDRNREIRAACKPFIGKEGVQSLLDSIVDDPAITIDQARKQILDHVGKGLMPADPQGAERARIGAGEDSRDKFATGAQAALMVRAGIEKPDRGNQFTGFALMELARASLRANNIDVSGMDKLEVLARVFSTASQWQGPRAAITHGTSDFPNLLANTAHKMMLIGYSEIAEDLSWTRTATYSDFKTTDMVGMSEFSSLDQVNPQGEFKYGSFGDRKEQIALLTFGKLFTISRQAIINDDLNAFSDIPRKMGRAAKRKVADLAWGVLTVNANMADGVALFHSTHTNLLASGTALSAASVSAARAAMALQKDSSSNATLDIPPKFLLVPRALEDNAHVITRAAYDPDTANKLQKPNPIAGYNLTVIGNARLDAASATAHYLMGDPNTTDTVVVGYLDGNNEPFMEQQTGWTVDGVEFKVRIDAAAKAADFRGMYKNPGA